MNESANPAKLSWENIKFTVPVPTTKEEKKLGMGKTK